MKGALRRGLGLALVALASALAATSGPAVQGLAAQSSGPGLSSQELAAMGWINLLRKGEFDSAAVRVEPEVRRELNAERLDSMWTQMERRLGLVERLEPGGFIPQAGIVMVNLDAVFEGQSLVIQVVMSSQMEVLAFTVRRRRR